ncbi:2-octaprenyl-6-methoxyphenyl hydroxylase [Marinobacter sp. SS21]|uniref:2-octaprenyl-6-methoxyphenyl hydroxylase n=1 Tax=Marinobacter sp. SS21 TaxID=2979460 RepID=UPI00232EBC5D|nr:2-octaprenyl-6-methoxyphenyl hydroxylase [Marinobacter sp. SS21]MDC0663195.1 2-octaprenyl-6-methoxyphenyl hydroxylase [Marinobacter sp. SS21]
MSEQKLDTDLVIAGGGLAGATLALALARAVPQLRVTVVEAFPLSREPLPDHYQPSFDARSTALAWGSRLIYEQLGLWPRLSAQATPIRHIHVSDRGRFGATRLAASEHGQEALGYVVDNRWLGLCLMAALRDCPQVSWRAPAQVRDVSRWRDGVSVAVAEGDSLEHLTAQCLVIADGGRSGLRERLGFRVAHSGYDQHALIANVSTGQSHGFTAYERFTPAGPMALLPQGGAGAGNTSALVWTLAQADLEQVLALDAADQCRRLQQRFGWRLGRINQIGQCNHYPLALSTVDEAIRPGVVLIGNAAHTLHPVAGQGFNLALRGIMALVEQFQQGLAQGLALGDLALLGRYQAHHRRDWQQTVRFSDSLIRIFGDRQPALALARDAGLVGLDLLPGVKRMFARSAMGLGARRPAFPNEPQQARNRDD